MKIKFCLLFIISFFFTSCNDKKENPKKTPVSKAIVESDSIAIDLDGILPVFEISNKVTAITFELNGYHEEKLLFNKIFNKIAKRDTLFSYFGNTIKPINANVIDTLGTFKILKSDALDEQIKKNIEKEYYLYGSKGFTKIRIEDVYFTVDECISNVIALKISQFNGAEIGHPLFCSKKKLNLKYGINYSNENKLVNDYFYSKSYDYTNPKNAISVYSNIGSYYFVYEDDFIWGKERSKSKINFPSRSIYKINSSKKVDHIWTKSLDLFGIPCD